MDDFIFFSEDAQPIRLGKPFTSYETDDDVDYVNEEDTVQSDIVKHDIVQSDIVQSDIVQSDIVQSDIVQSDECETGSERSFKKVIDTEKPNTVQPNTLKKIDMITPLNTVSVDKHVKDLTFLHENIVLDLKRDIEKLKIELDLVKTQNKKNENSEEIHLDSYTRLTFGFLCVAFSLQSYMLIYV